jgi:hypothetical protein
LAVQQRLPLLFKMLQAGKIDVRRAKVLVDGSIHLSDQTAQHVIDQILADAPSLTTGQLQVRLRKLCVEVDPDEASDRYATAVDARRIELRPTVDGTAHLFAFDLPPQDAMAASRRINELARRAKSKDDPRTADQIRADVYLDLLCGRTKAGYSGGTGGTGGVVDIRVDLNTLGELNDSPGELAGYGPVIADIARKVVADQNNAQWRYTVTDPSTGMQVATGTTRRRPSASQERDVQAIHATCVFPGCRMPSTKCDLDHCHDWAKGGPTTVGNLAPLCRHDHRIKHVAGWSYHTTADGRTEWTTKLGHRYRTARPPP